MIAPHQLEIRRLGDDQVALRYGEWEARRVVHLSGSSRPADQAPTPLGYSVGRWEGETLVVETSRVTANITGWEFEHSDQLRVIERFTRSEDGDTLLLTATIEDPSQRLFFRRLVRADGTELLPGNARRTNAIEEERRQRASQRTQQK